MLEQPKELQWPYPKGYCPRNQWPPNYTHVLAWRQQQLWRMRNNPKLIVGARHYYKDHPVEWINHWVTTEDPRLAAIPGRLSKMPFILFKRQKELVEFIYLLLKAQECGLDEKSRDMGVTWLCASVSVHIWNYYDNASVGWGSRKQELVDQLGVPDSIFEKMRIIIRALPPELLPRGFSQQDHMNYMKITNPENNATITGEIGDNIGRGGRKLLFFKDESAHYERPELIEASLSENTRVQFDLSSVHGLGNVFHRKREAGVDWEPGQPIVKGKVNVFVMDWSDHPEKTKEWYNTKRKKAEDEGLLHVFAQEIDRNYSASIEGIIISNEHVKAAIDAHKRLGFDDEGMWCAALDVADGGGDTNALAKRKGVILKSAKQWGARDTGQTARIAVEECRDIPGRLELQYDCVGVGAGVKAEANSLIEMNLMPKNIRFVPWNPGGKVINPDRHLIDMDRDTPLNKDFYYNIKAQAWWELRLRFERTWRAIRQLEGDPEQKTFTWKPEQLISLPSKLPMLRQIEKELSQPTASKTNAFLKLIVDKTPDGMRSPNLADAIVMCFWPITSSYDSSMSWV